MLRGRRSRPSRGSPSAIAPDETTQTGSPPPTIRRSRARARGARERRTRPPGPTTRLEPELDDDRHRVWRAVADDAVLAQPEIAVRDRAARAGDAVDVDPRLGRAGQLEAVGEPRRRVPEGGRPAVAVEEALGRGRVLGDDPGGEAGGLLVRDPHAPRRARRRARPSPSPTRSGSLAHSWPSGSSSGSRARRRRRGSRAPSRAKSVEERRAGRRRAAVDEREVEPVADAEPVEARLGERERLLGRGRRRGRRGRRRPRRARACGRRSRRRAARARPSLARCRAGSRAG